MSNTRKKQWRWPISPETVRAVLSSHSVLGLAFAAIIYLVCLTGTIAVFAPDLERLEQPGLPLATQLSDEAAGKALRTVAKLAPAGTTLNLTFPSPSREGAKLVAFNQTYEHNWAVSDDGAISPIEAVWTDFLVYLHICLHLPRRWGGFLVGLTGVALLSSLVSGILAHPRVIRDAFHLRLGGSRRLQEADWHNRLGIWGLPFHFALALTGALLGLSTVIVAVLSLLLYRGDMGKVYDLFIDPPLPVDASPTPLPDLAQLLGEARARMPGTELDSVMLEHPGRADMRLSVHGRAPRMLVAQDEVQFDVQGRIIREEHPRDLVAGTRILGGVGQLHFGWYGGLPLRIAYGLLGVALCVVTSSGVTIWLARRRDRGRAAPHWERIWSTICWGQPAVLALTALLALLRPGLPLTPAWLGLSLAALTGCALARRWSGAQLGRFWRRLLIIEMGLLVVLLLGRVLV